MRVSTTRGLDIQPLDLDDVSAIELIEQSSMPAPWSRMMFVSEIVKATSVCLGAFVDSALVGYVIVSRYVDAWHVMNLVVAPEHQRQGIATRLLVALFDQTAEDDSRGFTLEVRVSNEAAIELYKSMGFSPQGVRRGYYTDNREDALIMWRDPAEP
jgi:[ribosomal protein S18]-alanine N-acetyltransferase